MQADWSHYAETQYYPDTAMSITALPPRARGFDTSYWNHGPAGSQSPIDFQAAYLAGYSFWIGRLTRGQNYIDTWIEEDYAAASQTPLIKAVYHVLYPGEPVGPHIENLKRGLELLPEPPKAIALDLERGAEFGAQAVTKCLVDTIENLITWWGPKLLLYTNLNYLSHYIIDYRALDLWLAWPSDTAANPPREQWTIWQRSWEVAIPGVPDLTVDLDEFNGDELQMFAYFAAEPEPEPIPEPEENMDLLKIKAQLGVAIGGLSIVINALDAIAGELTGEIPPEPPAPPEPPEPPTPPPPAPSNVRSFKVVPANDKDKANARCIKEFNDAGRPVFVIYPNDSAPTSERQQFDKGVTVQVEGDIQRGDGGVNCYQLYDPESRYKARPLFIRKDDGYLV